MSRNSRYSGTGEVELVRGAEQAIRSALPLTWSLTAGRAERTDRLRDGDRPDAQFVIAAPDGTTAVVLLECRRAIVPRDIARVAGQLANYADAVARPGMHVGAAVVAAPFVSVTARTQLEQHGLGWFDLTGNLRLRLDRPAVFLDRSGADRSVFRDPADRQLKSLRGPAAARVVLELCDVSLPVGVRDLAARADVGLATSARVLELLDRDAVVTRNPDGAVTDVRKRHMIDRWTQDYHVMTSNDVVATLDPRGLNHALTALRSADARVVVTGSAAVRAYLPEDVTPVSPLASVSLYAEDPIAVMGQLGLRVVERGTNVLIMRPYDEVVHTKARQVEGIAYAAPAQVVADLLTGPGRASEEAEQLLAVLGSSDRGWQR